MTILNSVYIIQTYSFFYTSHIYISLQVYTLTLASNKTISLGGLKHSRGFAGKLKFIVEIFHYISRLTHTLDNTSTIKLKYEHEVIN